MRNAGSPVSNKQTSERRDRVKTQVGCIGGGGKRARKKGERVQERDTENWGKIGRGEIRKEEKEIPIKRRELSSEAVSAFNKGLIRSSHRFGVLGNLTSAGLCRRVRSSFSLFVISARNLVTKLCPVRMTRCSVLTGLRFLFFLLFVLFRLLHVHVYYIAESRTKLESFLRGK